MLTSNLYQTTYSQMQELYADIQLIDLPLPYDGVALTLEDLVYKEYYAWRMSNYLTMFPLKENEL